MRVKAVALLLFLVLVGLFGRRWISLAWNASNYPVAPAAARTQVVVIGDSAYLAAGTDGIEVVDLASGKSVHRLPPPTPCDRVDDVAAADGRLFALDATPPGHLAVFSLDDPARPELAGPVAAVPVGPFSGVAAAAGLVVVSGGTSSLTLHQLDERGRLGGEVATGDYGRGQPDVALRPDGSVAAISTHTFGPSFALTLVEIQRSPLALVAASRIDLPAAGFTTGGFKPAHFPIATAWRGNLAFVAAGGGLTVIDAADPRRARIVLEDSTAAPALDVVTQGTELDVLRAGAFPAVLRYRLDATAAPSLIGVATLPPDHLPAALARHGADVVVTSRGQAWRVLSPDDFSPRSLGTP